MSLKELGMEYLRQSEAIKNKIKQLREESKNMKPKQLYNLRGRLLALYSDAASLKTIGEYLISYYGEENE